MNEKPAYTEFHPRWLRRRVSTYWWLERLPFVAFITRELSSIFIVWFVLYLLLLVRAVGEGAARYREFLSWSAGPLIVLVNAVSLFFVVFHAVTWFNLAPQAIAMRVRGRRVPALLIAGANYAAWAVATAVVAWLLLGG